MKRVPKLLFTPVRAVKRSDRKGLTPDIPPRPPEVVILAPQDIAARLGLEARTVRHYQLQGLLGQRMGEKFDGPYCATEDQVAWFKKYVQRPVGRPPFVVEEEAV